MYINLLIFWYFIFSFKDSKIKIVNINPSQQKIITVIIKRHCQVSKEGWEHGRSMTYFFKITKIGNSSQIMKFFTIFNF